MAGADLPPGTLRTGPASDPSDAKHCDGHRHGGANRSVATGLGPRPRLVSRACSRSRPASPDSQSARLGIAENASLCRSDAR